MENLERRINNLEKHVDNIVKTMQQNQPVIETHSKSNLLAASAIVIAVFTLIMTFVLKG